MTTNLIPHSAGAAITYREAPGLPAIIQNAGETASKRFIEFFTANIRNPNTRQAYARAVGQFLTWCEGHGLNLQTIEPVHVAAYIESKQKRVSVATVKQHLAAIRVLFDWLVTGQVVPINPATSVRGPSLIVERGKTPVLTEDEARALLGAIDTSRIVGLRDRALIGVMLYSFARVSAVIRMQVRDYYPSGKRWMIRLHEKGGKHRDIPVHHKAEAYLDAYLDAASIQDQKKTPLFRSMGRRGELTERSFVRRDVLAMIRRRAKRAGLRPENVCCHSLRGTGITNYLSHGGQIETAQAIAGHSSPRTTKLYDRRHQEVELAEIERIRI